jgi:hypothetical protein
MNRPRRSRRSPGHTSWRTEILDRRDHSLRRLTLGTTARGFEIDQGFGDLGTGSGRAGGSSASRLIVNWDSTLIVAQRVELALVECRTW